MALNSLLRASFNLELPQSVLWGLKQPEMAKLNVFLIDLNISFLIRDQEESHHRGLMGKS